MDWYRVPQEFNGLARGVSSIEKSSLTSGEEAKEWTDFLKSLLLAKRVLPEHYEPTDLIIRDRLELGSDAKYDEEDIRLAEMQIVEEELLIIAYADYVLT